MGLAGSANSYPHQFSGDLQQRIGIEQAPVVRLDISLMDEPFGALDLQTPDLLQDELLRIWQTDCKTGLCVTRSIEEAIYLSDRIIVPSPSPRALCASFVGRSHVCATRPRRRAPGSCRSAARPPPC